SQNSGSRSAHGAAPLVPEPESGSAKTNNEPPSVVYRARSLYPPTAPSPSVSPVNPAAMPMPAQPPIPEYTPTYCLPLYMYVNTLPMIPEGVLNFHSSLPSLVLTTFR